MNAKNCRGASSPTDSAAAAPTHRHRVRAAECDACSARHGGCHRLNEPAQHVRDVSQVGSKKCRRALRLVYGGSGKEEAVATCRGVTSGKTNKLPLLSTISLSVFIRFLPSAAHIKHRA